MGSIGADITRARERERGVPRASRSRVTLVASLSPPQPSANAAPRRFERVFTAPRRNTSHHAVES